MTQACSSKKNEYFFKGSSFLTVNFCLVSFAQYLRSIKGYTVTLYLCLTVFSIVCYGNDENVLWQDDFSKVKTDYKKFRKGWKFYDIAWEKRDHALRIRENGSKSRGKMLRHLPFDLKNGKKVFLQIKLGQIENFANFVSAGNISSGGKGFGKLFSGWNTFDLSSQKSLRGRKASFCLLLLLRGVTGNIPGGWIDLELIRTLKIPYNGLTMALISDSSDKVARVGDKIMFQYYSPEKLPDKELPLRLKLFIAPDMYEYKFSNASLILNDNGTNGDEKGGDGIYSLVTAIDENALTFQSKPGRYLIAAVDNSKIESTGTAPFNCDIKTINEPAFPIVKGGTPKSIGYYKLWLERTTGKNLALGKKVAFSRTPDYGRTRKGNSDVTDLVDGKISSRNDDKIWFDSKTVGWYMNGAENGVNLLIDLETIKSVGSVVIRALGGGCLKNLISPREFKVFVSKDGKNFYEAASMEKLMPGEKKQSDFKRYYYLDEIGTPFVYPFPFTVNADARYIGISITGATGYVFTDEIAVMKAAPPTMKGNGFNQAYQGQPKPFHMKGIIVAPRIGKLVLSSNITLPNSFCITDMRAKKHASKKAELVIDLPAPAKIVVPNAKKTPIEVNGEKYFRWRMPLKKNGTYTPMFFISPGNENINEKTSYFSVKCEGVKPIKTEVPIQIVKVPVVTPQFKKLHISLAWMKLTMANKWPGFFAAMKKLGFNAVSCFPRYWGRTITKIQFFRKVRRFYLRKPERMDSK